MRLVIAALVVLGSAAAWSPPGAAGVPPGHYYTQLFAGVAAENEIEFEDGVTGPRGLEHGYAVGGVFGYGFNAPFEEYQGTVRTDVEISHRWAKKVDPAPDNETGFLTAFANLWVDLPVSERVVPYLGGGIGVGLYEPDSNAERGLAYQAGGGANYRVLDRLFLGMNYRYLRADFDESGVDAVFESHQVTLSIGVPLRTFRK